MSVRTKRLKVYFKGILFCSLLASTCTVVADEVLIDYIDDNGQTQILTIDANSSDADNALAATLILEGSRVTVILDEKDDLQVIADAVSAKAPDNATALAVKNTILGVGASLGGRSVERTSQTPETDVPQVATPPVAPISPPPPLPPPSASLPPPSSSVVSPN